MTVFGKFMKSTSQGMKATRVVPTATEIDDLQDFKLMPYESIELFKSKKKMYVSLSTKIQVGHLTTLERLNAITVYLEALHYPVFV